MKNVCAVILAAGRGTRMKSDLPKVLLSIGGKSMLLRGLETIKETGIKDILIVDGYRRDLVEKEAAKIKIPLKFILQKELYGTAHSLELALKEIPKEDSTILVLFADDFAFFTPETLMEFVTFHIRNKNVVTFLTSTLDDPNPIGGLELNEDGGVIGILRQSQLISKGLKKYPVLCGGFCFNKDWIGRNISKIEKSDLSGEYPLPYIYKVALEMGEFVKTFPVKNSFEWSGVNTPEELDLANKKLNLMKK